MDHEDFRRFEQLAQVLHFAKAADALGMSPSALTRRIQAMEEELGTPLFLRDQRSVRLTSAGERFRSFAQEQLDHWEQLKNELRQGVESPRGELRIACTVTACHTILPALLARSRERFPGVALHLATQDAARSLSALESGEVDLAVIPTDDPGPNHLATRALAHTELVFVAPASEGSRQQLGLGEPQNWKDLLRRAPLVAPLAGLDRERLDVFLRKQRIEARIVAEVRGNEGILAMVSLGSGIGLVPRLVLESSSLPVSALPEVPAPPGYSVSLCARPKSLSRDVVRVFWELSGEPGI
ncbi:MAG TPA: HTH-type transcriptional activator IlvY [Polyangiaceae bacterium]|nr:HTH-type transcriptional activator IlvY [Polyangiaceae bacterium]